MLAVGRNVFELTGFRDADLMGRDLVVALGLYGLAKLAEVYDPEVYLLTGSFLSGHSLKHLLAALAVFALYRMVAIRQPSNPITQ